jgi:hypothetical protein
MFCLEEHTDDNIVITMEFKDYYRGVTCECRFKTHISCWVGFIEHKGHVDCPICHKRYDPPPLPPTRISYIILPNAPVQTTQERVIPPDSLLRRRLILSFLIGILVFFIAYSFRNNGS